MASFFNSQDDDVFITSRGDTLSQLNKLSKCLASQLNFSRDCFASLTMRITMPPLFVYYPQPDDELEVLSYVGAAMQAALPERYRKANVTLVDRLTSVNALLDSLTSRLD